MKVKTRHRWRLSITAIALILSAAHPAAAQQTPSPPPSPNADRALLDQLLRTQREINQEQQRQADQEQQREDRNSPSAISCTQADQQIIAVNNAYDVKVDDSGAWPIISFHQGYAGPPRSIGIISPTMFCESRYGITQGGFNQPTGSSGGPGQYTVTCFRNGAIWAQQRVANLQLAWAGSTLKLAYHLQDGRETRQSATFNMLLTACVVETKGEELVQVLPDTQ